MLFLILIYYLAQGFSIDGSPIQSINEHLNPCTDLTHCRTIWNITWSCLITIFSCTWVDFHPNIPCPKKKKKTRNCFQKWVWNPLLSFSEYRLPLFVCALLVPEYVLAWEIIQYARAWKIANRNKCEFKTLDHIGGILTHCT